MLHLNSWLRNSGSVYEASFTLPNAISGIYKVTNVQFDTGQNTQWAIASANKLRLRWNSSANNGVITIPPTTGNGAAAIEGAFESEIDALIPGALTSASLATSSRQLTITTAVNFGIDWTHSQSTIKWVLGGRRLGDTSESGVNTIDCQCAQDPLSLEFHISNTISSTHTAYDINDSDHEFPLYTTGYIVVPFSESSLEYIPQLLQFESSTSSITITIRRGDQPEVSLPFEGRWQMTLQKIHL